MKNIAIIGASGMVGRCMLNILQERNFPMKNLKLFASSRSAGKKIEGFVVEKLTVSSFNQNIDIALFSAGGSISKEYAPIAVKKGCVVIDNSSAWRMEADVPLVVPEVNPDDILLHKGIIANPNCSTIQAVVALYPLHTAYNIKRIIFTTFQSVSGAGNKGIEDLERTANGLEPEHFPCTIAANCIPHIDSFRDQDHGYTLEEMKMINETRKILHAPDIKITATTVRVPVIIGHSIAINVTFENPFELNDLRNILTNSPGVCLQDDVTKNIYPTPIKAAGTDSVYVGRIRRDFSCENSLNMWVTADNIRKGAATNAVQIAECL